MTEDLVLTRYQKEMRIAYCWLSIGLAVLTAIMLWYQETRASAWMFALALVFIWGYHWNCGRRIRKGAFAAGMSVLQSIERADLRRWLEHHGTHRSSDGPLPG